MEVIFRYIQLWVIEHSQRRLITWTWRRLHCTITEKQGDGNQSQLGIRLEVANIYWQQIQLRDFLSRSTTESSLKMAGKSRS